MPAPSTAILESGTGADVSPLTTFTDGPDGGSYGGIRRVSNQLAGISGDAFDYYNVAQYGPTCEVYATFPVKPASGSNELGARTRDAGGGTYDQYALTIFNTAARISLVTNGGYSALGADLTCTFTAGDSFYLYCADGVQEAWQKVGAGSWTLLGTRNDTTLDGVSGHLTVYLADGTTRMTNFGGGTTVVAGATPRMLASSGVGK